MPLFWSAKLHWVVWRGLCSILQTLCSFLGDNSGSWIYRWTEMAKPENNLGSVISEPIDFPSAPFLKCWTCGTEHLQHHVKEGKGSSGLRGSSTATGLQILHHLELEELVVWALKPGHGSPGCNSFFGLFWCPHEEDETPFRMTAMGTA